MPEQCNICGDIPVLAGGRLGLAPLFLVTLLACEDCRDTLMSHAMQHAARHRTPKPHPFVLSASDQKFLRSLRIAFAPSECVASPS